MKIMDYLEETFWWPLERLWENIIDIPKEVQWFLQRGIRGWADQDVWSLDGYLSSWLPDALKKLKKDKHGYPCNLTEKKWDKILDQIIEAFKADNMIQECNNTEYKKLDKIRKKGLKLFIEYYSGLWD